MKIGKLEIECTWRGIEIWWGWKQLFGFPNFLGRFWRKRRRI